LCHESHIDRLACAQSKDIIHPTRFLRIKTWQRPWLPFPAGILRVPVFFRSGGTFSSGIRIPVPP
jgi:hypothetical protein